MFWQKNQKNFIQKLIESPIPEKLKGISINKK